MKTIKLINLETGEVREEDPRDIGEFGCPEDFEVAENISVDRWITALQNAIDAEEIARKLY